jgi:hypothetical protein
MGNILELRWHVDSNGYVLDGDGENVVLANRLATLAAMVTGLTDLLCEAEGGYTHVVPRGGQPKPYRCNADNFEILLDLLNMPSTREGVVGFVNQWGLLRAPSLEEQRRAVWFIATSKSLARVMEDGLPRSAGDLVLASLELVRGPTGRLFLRANTLEEFLWAQVFQLRHGAIFQCPICKKFALAPMTGRPPKYCSDACSSKAYRQGRTERRCPVADRGR